MPINYKPVTNGIGFGMKDNGISDLLERQARRLEHDTPDYLLKRVGPILRKSFAEQFAEGGSPDSWAELAPSTILRKRRQGQPALTPKGRTPRRLVQRGGFGPENILIAKGTLRDSYVRKGARGHVERVNKNTGKVEVGSSLSYAFYHQRTGRNRGYLNGVRPARPVIIRHTDVIEVTRAVHEAVNEVLNS